MRPLLWGPNSQGIPIGIRNAWLLELQVIRPASSHGMSSLQSASCVAFLKKSRQSCPLALIDSVHFRAAPSLRPMHGFFHCCLHE